MKFLKKFLARPKRIIDKAPVPAARMTGAFNASQIKYTTPLDVRNPVPIRRGAGVASGLHASLISRGLVKK